LHCTDCKLTGHQFVSSVQCNRVVEMGRRLLGQLVNNKAGPKCELKCIQLIMESSELTCFFFGLFMARLDLVLVTCIGFFSRPADHLMVTGGSGNATWGQEGMRSSHSSFIQVFVGTNITWWTGLVRLRLFACHGTSFYHHPGLLLSQRSQLAVWCKATQSRSTLNQSIK